MIKAIIFDCFGVLTGDAWKDFTATLSPDVLSDVHDAHKAYDRGFISYRDFSERTKQASEASQQTLDAIFLHRENRHKNSDLLKHIQDLGEHYKISVLSNVGTAWIREEFLTPAEVALFDDMVLSFEVGLSKPDSQIYLLACQRLGIEPQEAIFVDDLEPYCQAAEAVGLRAVQYRDFQQYKADINALLANANN